MDESRSARHALGNPGNPPGPDVHASGLRVDGHGYAGCPVSPAYDSLLAKLIASAADYPSALRRAYRALCEFRLEGVASNLHLLQNLLQREEVIGNRVDTRFIEQHLAELLGAHGEAHPHRYFAAGASGQDSARQTIDAPPGTLASNAPSSPTTRNSRPATVAQANDVAPNTAMAIKPART